MTTKEIDSILTSLAQYITPHKRELIEQVLHNRTRHVTVAVEDIFQQHNASAVVRSCEIFGLQDIHIVENQYHFEALNSVAMGATKWIDMHRYPSTTECIKALKQKGYRIVATTPNEQACSLYDLPLEHKMALLFGTENTGLSQEALDLADEFMVIPMHGFTRSFNISVSVALCLQHIISSLHQSSINWKLTEQEKQLVRLQWYRSLVRAADKHEEMLNKK